MSRSGRGSLSPSELTAALGVEQYIVQSAVIAGVACLLLLLQGLYDEERVPPGLPRLQAIVSAMSVGLAVALIAPSLSGADQSFSRLWFATAGRSTIVGAGRLARIADRVYARCAGARPAEAAC